MSMFFETNVSSSGEGESAVANEPTPRLYAEARQGIAEYYRAEVKAWEGRFALRDAALLGLYRLCWALGEDQSRIAKFCSQHGITVDPRAKNPLQPIIKTLLNSSRASPEHRTKVSTWTGAITSGIRAGLDAEQFVEHVRGHQGGLDGVYNAFTKSQRSKNFQIEAEAKLHNARELHQEAFPPVAFDLNSITDHVIQGMVLLVATADADGIGRILAQLDKKPENVARMYDEYVLRWAASHSRDTLDA